MVSKVIWFLEWSGYFWTAGLIVLAILAAWFLPKVGWHLAIGLLVLAGCSAFLRHAYSDGVSAERAKWQAALAQETARREAAVKSVQDDYSKKVAALEAQKAAQDKHLEAIRHASAVHDSAPGLSADGVRRLNALVPAGRKHRAR